MSLSSPPSHMAYREIGPGRITRSEVFCLLAGASQFAWTHSSDVHQKHADTLLINSTSRHEGLAVHLRSAIRRLIRRAITRQNTPPDQNKLG